MRQKLIVANWKMNGTNEEGLKFFAALQRHFKGVPNAEAVICPPFTALYALEETFSGTPYKLGAQNMHWEESGAFTGEISPLLLRELHVQYVILGHSERRRLFGEDDRLINKKVAAALEHQLNPIVCVGENEAEHKEGKTFTVVEGQVKKILEGQMKSELEYLLWAYEPVWAIGTGKNATPEHAQEVIQSIRKWMGRVVDAPAAEQTRILYGGSVSDHNAAAFLKQPDIDGLLVGGASLDAKKFAAILEAADQIQKE